jgi:hypothetical protein
MNRIALVARRKSGKSEVARMLARSHGFTRVALADPLKESAVVMLNQWLEGQGDTRRLSIAELEQNKAVFRPLLEWLGTPFGRRYLNTPDRWIDRFVRAVQFSSERVVCDDMRQPNEADMLRSLGFVIVRVERPEHLRQAALFEANEPRGPMPSEQFIDEIEADAVIENGGSLDDLAAQVCGMADWAKEVAA